MPLDLLRRSSEPRSHGAPRLRAIQQCDKRPAVQRFVGIPALGRRPPSAQPSETPRPVEIANERRDFRCLHGKLVQPHPAPQTGIKPEQKGSGIRSTQRADHVEGTHAPRRGGGADGGLCRRNEDWAPSLLDPVDDARSGPEIVGGSEPVAASGG